MKRAILPVQFASAIQTAQGYRQSGESLIVSAHIALDVNSLSRDWAAILIAVLDSSPVAAEKWAADRISDALDRSFGRVAESGYRPATFEEVGNGQG